MSFFTPKVLDDEVYSILDTVRDVGFRVLFFGSHSLVPLNKIIGMSVTKKTDVF